MKNKIITILLAGSLCLGIAGCGRQGENQESKSETGKNATDLMSEIKTLPEEDTTAEPADISLFSKDTTDFAIALLQENLNEKSGNVMVSPVSVVTALAMSANGAKEETLSQMLSVIGRNQDLEELNANLRAWTNGLSATEDAGMKVANSIWFKDDEGKIQVAADFLKKNAKYYAAGIYKAPFDESTLSEINTWVSDHTDGMIGQILNEIPQEAVMYLVNAVAFEAKWQEIYNSTQIREGSFTNEDGQEKNVEFMHSKESIYFSDGRASGFVKPYQEGYRFVAVLPNEGITPKEYAEELTGEHFARLLSDAREGVSVYAGMPKFEAEYDVELKDVLTAMGMPDAFDEEKADFSGLGTSAEGNIYVNKVLHKTYICVDEMGTKAGAATTVEIATESAVMEEEVYFITLNRPFLYAIIEEETNIPLFIGVVNNL